MNADGDVSCVPGSWDAFDLDGLDDRVGVETQGRVGVPIGATVLVDDEIHIGTSGWSYGHWVGPYYPPGTKTEQFLDRYAERLRTVEVNSIFYRLPERSTLEKWRQRVPEGFFFAVKANRWITHLKKLRDPRGAVQQFLEHIDVLGEKLGPILFQLPPKWHVDIERFQQFLEVLPSGYRYAFEFRDTTWFSQTVYEVLSRHNAGFCVYDLAGVLSPTRVTSDFVYVRLHGPEAPYRGSYSDEVLEGWAAVFRAWSRTGRQVYCYFDNDDSGYAICDALRLRKMLGTAEARS